MSGASAPTIAGLAAAAAIALPLLSAPVPARATTLPAAPEARRALRRAAEHLWSCQTADGGWRGERYAVLRSGQALTPFVLCALLDVPAELAPRPAGGVERALDFIRARVDAAGALGTADPDILEYPVYATSHALRALVRAGRAGDAPLVARMRRWLLGQQFAEAAGFAPHERPYGGWGFGGGGVTSARPGHMDLAHTRRALEALRDAGGLDAAAGARAATFLALVQRLPGTAARQPDAPDETATPGDVPFDGGFYFSPVVLGANKGRRAPATPGRRASWRSYATATCDGALALLAAGVAPADPRVRAARLWLEEHPLLARAEGIPTDHPEPWAEALATYHLAVRAEAHAALGIPGPWRAEIASLLARRQRGDGSFVNEESPLMKEDERVLCTALATVALARCARVP